MFFSYTQITQNHTSYKNNKACLFSMSWARVYFVNNINVRGGSRQKSDWCFICIEMGVVRRGRTSRSDHGYGLSLSNQQCINILIAVMENFKE